MSDHGECFGEGNVYFDHHGLYDAVTRVALLWHDPESQRRCNALSKLRDIMPTLAERCGWEVPEYELSSAASRCLMMSFRAATSWLV
jgi:arylsulfatase A-like enzyme